MKANSNFAFSSEQDEAEVLRVKLRSSFFSANTN